MRHSHPRFEQVYSDQLEMVRPLISPVSVPPVPEGYRLRLLRDDEEQRYDDLFHLAFDVGTHGSFGPHLMMGAIATATR